MNTFHDGPEITEFVNHFDNFHVYMCMYLFSSVFASYFLFQFDANLSFVHHHFIRYSIKYMYIVCSLCCGRYNTFGSSLKHDTHLVLGSAAVAIGRVSRCRSSHFTIIREDTRSFRRDASSRVRIPISAFHHNLPRIDT